MAQYPNSVPSFTTKHNITDIVDESHPNSVQDEVIAIAQELGVNVKNSAALATNYGTLDARLEWIEANYRQITNHDSHGLLTGLAGDDHTQYTRVDGSRAFTGSTAITAAPVATAVGDAQSQGVLHTLSRSDHRHAHTGGSPVASAVIDTASDGVATTTARSDHRHAREGFGAVVTELAYGQAQANGSAATVARSDHTHGTVSLSSTTPTTQAIGDAAAIGSGSTAAKSDHKHAMPSFGGTVTDERTWGIAPAVGVSAQVSRADHTHGSPDATLTGPSGVIAMWPTASPPTGWLICDGTAVSRSTYSVLFGILGTTFGAGNGSTTFNLPDYRGRVPIGAGTGTGGGASGTGAPTGGSALTARSIAGWSGAETHTLVTGEMPSHQHTTPLHSHGSSTANSGGPSAHRHSYEHGHSLGDNGHNHNLGNRNPSTVFDGVGGILVSRGDGTSTVVDYNRGSANGRDLLTYVDIFASYTGTWVNGTGYVETGTETVTISHGHNLTIAGNNPTTDLTGGGSAHNNMQPVLGINFIVKT